MDWYFYNEELAAVTHHYELDLLDAKIKFLRAKCRIMPGFRKFLIMKEDIAFHGERAKEYKAAEQEGRLPVSFVEHRNQFNPDKRVNDAFDSVNTETTAALDNAIAKRRECVDRFKKTQDKPVRMNMSII
jgi:hypothetical protein